MEYLNSIEFSEEWNKLFTKVFLMINKLSGEKIGLTCAGFFTICKFLKFVFVFQETITF